MKKIIDETSQLKWFSMEKVLGGVFIFSIPSTGALEALQGQFSETGGLCHPEVK